MINVDCPWCDGSATVAVGDRGTFSCSDCSITVELAQEPTPEPVAQAA